MNEELLPSETWEKIKETSALGRHRLAWDKASIERAIANCRRRRSATKEERRLVQQTRDAACKTVYLLSRLVRDQAFLCIGIDDPNSISATVNKIVHAAEALVEIEREMDEVLNRYDHAGDSLIFPEYGALEELVFDLLMIHAASLETAPPTSPHHRFGTPDFLNS